LSFEIIFDETGLEYKASLGKAKL